VFHVKNPAMTRCSVSREKGYLAENAQRVLTSTEMVWSPAEIGVSAWAEAMVSLAFISIGRGGGA
jgi:peptidoglycan biosynthesis protein MviN/MurJ (putative lipid II flippase)